MNNETFRLDNILGHVKLVQVQEQRGDKIYLGGYSIDYDRNGMERGRSEVRWNVVIECGDSKTAKSLCPTNAKN